jgi:superfamily II DNA/RNA helicase
MSFADLGVPAGLVEVVLRRGITRPLPIQEIAIADILAGRDVSGKAPTGTGKTLAFALPMAATISRGAPKRPSGLVLAPTRELAAQIAAELTPLLAKRGMKAYPFYGGNGFSGQRAALRAGTDVAVACPGRLEDLMRSGEIFLSGVKVVVIDEADRMADMGFLPAVRRILDATPSERQTLLFSATLDGDVDVLVRHYQRRPVRHEVVAQEVDLRRVSHQFHSVATTERVALCAKLVGDAGSAIVFVRTKHGADNVARQLARAGLAAAAIHGDRSQAQRERALAAFRSGDVQALVATDVAARGIHVADVACVVHYDLPDDPKDYLHRSGRTARAGAQGSVISLVTSGQQGHAASLQRALGLGHPSAGGLSQQEGVVPPRSYGITPIHRAGSRQRSGSPGRAPSPTPGPTRGRPSRRGRARG